MLLFSVDMRVMASSKHLAIFRFYAELNDFLPPERRSAAFAHPFELRPSIKDLIESLGVPHTEIELILVNDAPVHFSYAVRDGDRISIYPAFTRWDSSVLPQLRQPLRDFRFILDAHLGRLARYLRLLGFDSVYDRNADDRELARVSHHEGRILLTRDVGLLKRAEVTYGYFVRDTRPMRQAFEVVRRFDLGHRISPFRRCLRCNSVLVPIPKESILERLEPQTRKHFNQFQTCPTCQRIYWPGSHYEHMQRVVRRVVEGVEE